MGGNEIGKTGVTLAVDDPQLSWIQLAFPLKLLDQTGADESDLRPVSYTHLDVYKRQGLRVDGFPTGFSWA